MQLNRVILGTYNHMPEGSAEADFERRYQSCWRPYLSVLYRFPEVSSLLHYSGTVLKWLELRHPEFLMLLEEMVLRKQIELLGGAFFSPLLPLLPASDRLGQIELLTTYIRKAFGKRPMGGWLHEYVWEPGFASLLQACGFEYTFLPASRFVKSGAACSERGKPVITEDQGKTIAVFPVDDLGEGPLASMPFESAYEILRAKSPDAALHTILMDSALTVEMWRASGLESPDVMFERSFAWFQRNLLETETTTPQKFFRSMRRFELAYFPSGSSKWGFSPRSLIARGDASRCLYAKMQYVHLLAGQVRGDKSRKKSAHEELWKGQCGEAYWESPEGGILRPELRAAAYSSLLEAEKTTRLRGSFAAGLIQTDIDFDGEREVLYQGTDINCYIHLMGASVFELDSFRSHRNFVDSLPDGQGNSRRSFMDRFFRTGSFREELCDFSGHWYSLHESDKPAQMAVFGSDGAIRTGGRKATLSLRKTYLFRKNGLSVDYELLNLNSEDVSFRFASELNLVPSNTAGFGLILLRDRERLPVDIVHGPEQEPCEGFRIEVPKAKENIEFRSDGVFFLQHEPIFGKPFLPEPFDAGASPDSGVSAGPEQVYQGSRFLCGWDIDLPADGVRRVSLTLEFGT
ncbi:MAG: alpha-amylase/4-alpha-glucanotransferase domain-containing protein [Rectinemataceae bacterium]